MISKFQRIIFGNKIINFKHKNGLCLAKNHFKLCVALQEICAEFTWLNLFIKSNTVLNSVNYYDMETQIRSYAEKSNYLTANCLIKAFAKKVRK
ncbi:hypothetical protein LMANV2_470014 [Leptospira interrogans serovar Manilae]|uniref:Uncharacterized protein n=1 Tax=Leptospira interrogans serovar Manilae TaxID=214675 RepID=A0AAQ1SPJ5_LEPIR|nr:hypothetical protein LMANV2_470014 [Leptospira interrogans serovar Manilae]